MAAEDPGKRFDSVDKDRRKRRFEDADKKRASKRFARADALRAGSDTKTAEKEPEVKSPEKLSRVVDSVFRDVAKDTNTSISTLRNRSGQSVVDAVKARLGGMDPASEDYQRILSQISPNRREAVHAAIEKNLNKDFSDKKDTSKGDGADSSDSVDVLKDAMKGERKKAFDKMLADYKKVSGTEPGKETKEKIEKIWNEMYKKESDDAERLTLIEKYAKEGVDQRLLQLSAMSAGAQYAREKAILEGIQERMQLKEEVQQLRADFNSLRAQWQQQAPQPAMAPQQQWQRPIGPAGYESPYGMAQPGYRWVQEPIPGYVPPQPQQAPAPEAPRAEAPRAEKAPGVIHMPPDPTLETGEEAPKSPEQKAVEEMKKAVEGKMPKLVEQKLLEMEGRPAYNKWRALRTIGLIGLTAGVGIATTMTFSAPLVAALGVKSYFTAAGLPWLGTIATGALTGSLTGGIISGARGVLESRRAAQNLAEGEKLYNPKGHVFRKLFRGMAFGAIGGGIGAGVMDAYGDQIREGAGALGEWANKEATDLKEGLSGAKDWISGLFGSGAVTEMPATPVLPGCTSADAMNALRVDVDGIKEALSTIISNQTVDAQGIKTIAEAVKSGVSLSDLQSVLAGVQTNIESSISELSLEQQAYFRELFNRYGDTAYYFFQQDIVMPDVPVDASSDAVVEPASPVETPTETTGAETAESVSAIDQAVMDAFTQPVTNGGVWTASERVWSAVGITPESGRVGSLDLLTYLTDLAEDYTQDGSVIGTRETSYFRNLGEGLLARMTGQEGVTQATIRNPINMAELFGNEKIQQDILRRISENPALSDQTRRLIEASAEKIFALANTALSK